MSIQFAPKSAVIAANVPQNIVWSAQDLQNHLGEYPTTRPMNISLAITNPGSQVLYFGLSYTTLYNTISLVEKRSFGAVPNGGTQVVTISGASVSALSNIPRDIVSITLTVTSLAATTVRVVLSADIAASNGTLAVASGNVPILGLDAQTSQDYTPYTFSGNVSVLPGAVQTLTLVPLPSNATKVIIDSLYVFVPRTAYQFGDVTVALYLVDTNTFIPINIAFIVSLEYLDTVFSYVQDIEIISPYALQIDVTNNNPTITHVSYATVKGKTVLV